MKAREESLKVSPGTDIGADCDLTICILAAAGHVEKWAARVAPGSASGSFFRVLAEDQRWEHHTHRTIGVARGIYLRLPGGTMLWMLGRNFEPAEPQRLASLFSRVQA